MLWKCVCIPDYIPKSSNADSCAIVRVGDIESKNLGSGEKGGGQKAAGFLGVIPRQVGAKSTAWPGFAQQDIKLFITLIVFWKTVFVCENGI